MYGLRTNVRGMGGLEGWVDGWTRERERGMDGLEREREEWVDRFL
jgi:hypothetical protein